VTPGGPSLRPFAGGGPLERSPAAIAATPAIAAAIPATGRYDPTPVTDTETPGTETAVTNAELAEPIMGSLLRPPGSCSLPSRTFMRAQRPWNGQCRTRPPTCPGWPPAEEVAGGTEGEATVPELGDEAEPFQMLLVLDGGPAATVGLGEDVDGLVEADRARRHPGAAWWPGSAARVHASTHRVDRTARRRRQPRPAPVGPVRAPAVAATSVGTEPGAAPAGASPGRFARSPVRRRAP